MQRICHTYPPLQAAKQRPTDVEIWNALLLALSNAGEFDSPLAQHVAERARILAPANIMAAWHLANLYDRPRELEVASLAARTFQLPTDSTSPQARCRTGFKFAQAVALSEYSLALAS